MREKKEKQELTRREEFLYHNTELLLKKEVEKAIRGEEMPRE